LSASLPNHEGWIWSQSTFVFPETRDRVIVVFNRNGKMIEDWSQWDRIEKHIWIVDAHNHFVTEFTHDGKTRLLTLGTRPGRASVRSARRRFFYGVAAPRPRAPAAGAWAGRS